LITLAAAQDAILSGSWEGEARLRGLDGGAFDR